MAFAEKVLVMCKTGSLEPDQPVHTSRSTESDQSYLFVYTVFKSLGT